MAPGKTLRQEIYLRLQMPGLSWYAKAGQFYLPFGWRLQYSLAFVRQLSGISMTVPDKGLELGHESEHWSIQWVRSRGPGIAGGDQGHQTTAQVTGLHAFGRVGLGLARSRSPAGDRRVLGVFAGTQTGPVAWLAELNTVSDNGFPEAKRRQAAALLEGNWLLRQGHNLKLTGELLDPDRRVANDHKTRTCVIYEYTPYPVLQLRAGYRHFAGIPQNALDNRRQAFV